MSLIYPFVLCLLGTRVSMGVARRRGVAWARPWATWSSSSAVAMSAVLLAGSATHFVEPQRSGLLAIVPTWIPLPGRVVAVTGVVEALLAVGLSVPRTRRRSAIATIGLLLVMYPANVIAAKGVEEASAPDSPLPPRTLLQIAFIGACALAARSPVDRGSIEP
ncbi:hypothetical protein C5E07_18845 [Pseudoclavibacter sp. RFBJ3]|uniref:DoxX family protein n=1 Tax=unclassified Pseudoclavibacter TaxID=2615177 RepID=UPI000CE7AD21|nr:MULTISPECIES: hypothetical protein [unclassified Pseudoclavibacter]PPF87252.1 hypothetical protein C5C12_01065 [Pseudoclavibacter sp. RFBJ5]PPF88681.1 hypothetical protein C5E07_18845 [Pseudoclavibacter sp. RFBJ3]PPF93424.1 hypothetical protein C5C19_18945 [Pseudoclavibacter sp. RFBH5]PPG17574.1 hypothetical protein C5E13_18855 [Pseudoclavibacter sp. RFBI4]